MQQLLRRWTEPANWTAPVSQDALDRIETHLTVEIPRDYRHWLCEYGVPRISPSLPEAMKFADPGWALAELFNPDLIVELALEWRRSAFLCEDLIPIGRDARGYIICLGGCIGGGYEEDEGIVMVYNIDTGDVWDLCDTFTDYVRRLSGAEPRNLH